jgi:uncharacterized membrane protein
MLKRAAGIGLEPELIFVVIALVFGIFFIFATPLLWGQDEEAHFARAYQLSEGKLSGEQLNKKPGRETFGGNLPSSIVEVTSVRVRDILIDKKLNSAGAGKVDDHGIYVKVGAQRLESAKQVPYVFPNTVVYAPVAYLPAIIPILIARVLDLSIGSTIILSRLAYLLVYVSMVAGALLILKQSRIKWLFFVAALLPTTLYQGSVISTDGIVNGAALLLLAVVVKGWLLGRKLSRLERWLAVAMAVLLPLTKITYGALDLFLLFIPNSSFGTKRPTLFKWLTLTAAAIVSIVWSLLVAAPAKTIAKLAGSASQGFGASLQIHHILHAPFNVIEAFLRTLLLDDGNMLVYLFGQMSAALVSAPGTAIVCSAVALVLATLYTDDKIRLGSRQFWPALLIIIAGVLAIFGVELLTFTAVSAPTIGGVQGRYFFPFLVAFLTLVAAWLAGKRLNLGLGSGQGLIFQKIIYALVSASLLLTSIKFFYVLWA